METWPWSKYVSCPGGASASPDVCSLELRSSLLLPNSQPPPPWETSVVVYWKQPQPAMPNGSHMKLRLLFLNAVLWVGGFLSSQGFEGFVILPLAFASNHGGHTGHKCGFIDCFLFGKHLRLVEMKLCCKWDTLVSAVKSKHYR